MQDSAGKVRVRPVIKSSPRRFSIIQAVLDKLLSTTAAAADDDDDSGGMYAVTYRADIAGQYVVRVLYGVQQVTGSPFNVTVNPVGNAEKVVLLS